MIRKQAASAILAAVALQASLAHGLGLGAITLRSALNEPLNAEIRLRGAGDLHPDQIRVRLGSADEFEHAGVERLSFLSDLHFSVRVDADGDGVVHISSSRPVREPYLDFIIEARWPSGRVLREYTLLLDLPIYTSTSTTAAAPAPRQAPPVSAHGGGDDGGLAPGQGEYRVRRGDTLWSIATRSRPAGVSVRQMINAIHRDNPRAFINGDVDRMLAGAVLRLPQGSDLADLSTPASHAGGSVAPSSTTVERAPHDATPTQPVAEAEAEAERAEDARLEIAGDALASADTSEAAGGESRAAGGGGGIDAASDGILHEAQESLSAAERENQELQERIKALEAQVVDFQKLADIEKNKEQAAALDQPVQRSLIERVLDSTLTWVAVALALLVAMVAFLSRRRREVRDFVPVPFDEPRMPAPATRKSAEAIPTGTAAPVAGPAAAAVVDAAGTTDPLTEADVCIAYGQRDQAEKILREALLHGHSDQQQELRLKLMELLAARGDEGEFLRQYGALAGNADAQRAGNTILEQHGLSHWVSAPQQDLASSDEPLLRRDQPLQVDLAAELQQVADTLGSFSATKGAASDKSALLSRTEEAIARAAAELGPDQAGLDDLGSLDLDAGDFALSLDLDDAEEDDEETGTDAIGASGFELPVGEFELDSAAGTHAAQKLDEDLELLVGSDETATKLELAKAYLDMGDEEGAREILEEVTGEGDAAQREEAAAMLAGLGGTP